MTGLTECGVLRCVVALAKVIDAVTRSRFNGTDTESVYTQDRKHSQVADDDVRGGWWVV